MRTFTVLPLTGSALVLALSCAPREVHLGVDKGGACDVNADPADEDALVCQDGYTCEPVAGGDAHVCATPIVIKGQVHDALTKVPLEGALVTALDRTSAPVSNVVVTAADCGTTIAPGKAAISLTKCRTISGR